MAGEFVSLVLDACDDCSTSETLVLVILADCANRLEAGYTYPSQEEIARRAKLAERQTRDLLHQLCAKQHITAAAYAHGGRGKATVYHLEFRRMVQRMEASGDPDLIQKAAAHRRVLSKLPGTPAPAFFDRNPALRRIPGTPAPPLDTQKAALQRTKGGNFGGKGGTPAHKTRHPAAPQPLEPRTEPETEPQHLRAAPEKSDAPRAGEPAAETRIDPRQQTAKRKQEEEANRARQMRAAGLTPKAATRELEPPPGLTVLQRKQFRTDYRNFGEAFAKAEAERALSANAAKATAARVRLVQNR
jgi:hypothetical protein